MDSDLLRLNSIAQIIYDKKGTNILVLDVRKVSSLTEYFVIAEGTVSRHIQSLARAVIHDQLDNGHPPLRLEGDGDWVVVDFGHIIIHLMSADIRELYRIEELWHEGKIVDVNIKIGSVA